MCVASVRNPFLPNELQAKVFNKALWLLHVSVLVSVGLTPPMRTEGQAGAGGSRACGLGGSAQWERVDIFQLARVLLTVLACRMIRYRFGNGGDEVGTAAPEWCWEEEAGCTPPAPPPLIVLGAAQAPNCKASPIAPFHYLCSRLADTAPSGMMETHKEPSREYLSSMTEARFFRRTYTYFECQFLYFHDLRVPFCPADTYTMFIDYPSERTQQTKLDS